MANDCNMCGSTELMVLDTGCAAEENRSCTCGNLRSIVVREGLLEMEAAARRFEMEEGILEEALKEPSIVDGTCLSEEGLEEHRLTGRDYIRGYVPYGDSKVEGVESQSTSSGVSYASGKDVDTHRCASGKLKRLVKTQANAVPVNSGTIPSLSAAVPQIRAAVPSCSDDIEEALELQSFETAQSEVVTPSLEHPGGKKAVVAKLTNSVSRRALEEHPEKTCGCYSQV